MNVKNVQEERAMVAPIGYLFSAGLPMLCGAGFQTCCVADFQVGSAALRPAGLETRATADLEVCATHGTRGNPKWIAGTQPRVARCKATVTLGKRLRG